VSNADDKYRLSLGTYFGDAGDSFNFQNGQQFSTYEQENDVAPNNCAVDYHGAWWYGICHRTNLNGNYADNSYARGLNWNDWRGLSYSLRFSEMKMRPV
jgi:hypothetical protein